MPIIRNPNHDPKNGEFTSGANTNSVSFKVWFHGSKVVDEKGKPLLVYHGASSKFEQFDDSHHRVGGHWFSLTENDASSYAGMGEEEHQSFGLPGKKYQDTPDAYVYECYLSIRNPASKKIFDKIQDDVEDPNLPIDPDVERKSINALIKRGYDGINNNGEWVAFYASQIRINKVSKI